MFALSAFAPTSLGTSSLVQQLVAVGTTELHVGGDAHLRSDGASWSTLRASTVDNRSVLHASAYPSGLWAIVGSDRAASVARFAANAWTVIETELVRELTPATISAADDDTAWIGGPGGAAEWNGTAWVQRSVSPVHSIQAVAQDDVVLVTPDGATRWDGQAFAPVAAASGPGLLGARRHGDTVFVFGDALSLVERRSGTWTPIVGIPLCDGESTPDTIVDVAEVGAPGSEQLWVLGNCVRRRVGTAWSQYALPAPFATRLHAVGPNEIWVSGQQDVYFPAQDTSHPVARLWRLAGPAFEPEALTGELDLGEPATSGDGMFYLPLRGGRFFERAP